MDDADKYASSQISALTAGYDQGLRALAGVCPWKDTEQLGWEWEFGHTQGIADRLLAAKRLEHKVDENSPARSVSK